MPANIIGGPVKPWVQAFADALVNALGSRISHISTYNGHQPTRDRALDIFPKDRAGGDAVLRFYKENWRRFGGDYAIWWQRIWNPEVSPHDRLMADRGSKTANHYDHNHLSFEATGSASPSTPPPKIEEKNVQAILFVHGGLALDVGWNPVKGKRPFTWELNALEPQRFRTAHYDKNTDSFNIVHIASNLHLDVEGGSQDNGAVVTLWAPHVGHNQRFSWVPKGPGLYAIKALHSGKLLYLAGANTNLRTELVQWDEHPGNHCLVFVPWVKLP